MASSTTTTTTTTSTPNEYKYPDLDEADEDTIHIPVTSDDQLPVTVLKRKGN
jgi:hypothetical protein